MGYTLFLCNINHLFEVYIAVAKLGDSTVAFAERNIFVFKMQYVYSVAVLLYPIGHTDTCMLQPVCIGNDRHGFRIKLTEENVHYRFVAVYLRKLTGMVVICEFHSVFGKDLCYPFYIFSKVLDRFKRNDTVKNMRHTADTGVGCAKNLVHPYTFVHILKKRPR